MSVINVAYSTDNPGCHCVYICHSLTPLLITSALALLTSAKRILHKYTIHTCSRSLFRNSQISWRYQNFSSQQSTCICKPHVGKNLCPYSKCWVLQALCKNLYSLLVFKHSVYPRSLRCDVQKMYKSVTMTEANGPIWTVTFLWRLKYQLVSMWAFSFDLPVQRRCGIKHSALEPQVPLIIPVLISLTTIETFPEHSYQSSCLINWLLQNCEKRHNSRKEWNLIFWRQSIGFLGVRNFN